MITTCLFAWKQFKDPHGRVNESVQDGDLNGHCRTFLSFEKIVGETS